MKYSMKLLLPGIIVFNKIKFFFTFWGEKAAQSVIYQFW